VGEERINGRTACICSRSVKTDAECRINADLVHYCCWHEPRHRNPDGLKPQRLVEHCTQGLNMVLWHWTTCRYGCKVGANSKSICRFMQRVRRGRLTSPCETMSRFLPSALSEAACIYHDTICKGASQYTRRFPGHFPLCKLHDNKVHCIFLLSRVQERDDGLQHRAAT